MSNKLLIINPGSTSTKIAVYENEKELFVKSIFHPADEIGKYATIADQYEMRKEAILGFLKENNVSLSELSAIIARGGALPPIKTGGYLVNDSLVARLNNEPRFHHASNLGAPIAKGIADEIGIKAYIYDGVSASEFSEKTKITGIPEIKRESFCHVLNTKAMARVYAKSVGKKYEEMNLVVLHLGGGITAGYHQKGAIIDSTSDDIGCFAPERAGSVPLTQFIHLCYSGKFTESEMEKKVRGRGGLYALLGTTSCIEIEERINNGDERAKLVYEAMANEICKTIGYVSLSAEQLPDAIVITGGIAHSKMLTGMISKRVSQLAPVTVLPGENEMESLALGGLRIMLGQEEALEYTDEKY